ncbi:MAG: cytochrome c3 family protein [Candidatus Solibacter sp.]
MQGHTVWKVIRRAGIAAGVALLAVWGMGAQDAPPQPLPFSHKAHAGALKLQCKMCHANPDPGDAMTIAATKTCMQCHSAIKKEAPAIQKLAEYAAKEQDVPWVRVYEVPPFVYFGHRAHLAKNTCDDCHGKVAERDALYKEVTLDMAACIDCHAGKQAGVGCGFCHDPR